MNELLIRRTAREPKCHWLTSKCLEKNTQLTGLQFSSIQSLNRVLLFGTPWITAYQASLSITNSWSLPKLMPIESVMPPSHLILCRPPLLLPPIPPRIRVFSNESTLRMRWPKYWNFSFSISPSNEHPGLTSFRMDWGIHPCSWISLQSKGLLQGCLKKVKGSKLCESKIQCLGWNYEFLIVRNL